MMDYAALRAMAAVARTGSFEQAARALNVTPSAVSQRVKHLEERLGTALVVRGSPCVATEAGERLWRHFERVSLLEGDLMRQLPALATGEAQPRVTLRVATNADSLGTWLLPALASVAQATGHLLDIAVDDEDHTAEWLRQGRVLAAVTSLAKPVQGCRALPLGVLRYRATASPEFVARHFPHGVTGEALAAAPAVTFNAKDRLQARWLKQAFGVATGHATHWLPSTHGFVDACLLGMAWGMNPEVLAGPHLASGRLVDLAPDAPLDVPLTWQVNRLAAEQLDAITRAVIATARARLPRSAAEARQG